MSPRSPVLRANDVRVHFEGVKAVDGVSLDIEKGVIVGLIGPNGAGKTTLVNALSGFQRVTAGRLSLDDVEITGWGPARRARAGIVRTFQDVRLFGELTVSENVEAGAVGVGVSRREAKKRTDGLLVDFDLTEWAEHRAHELPHGAERMLGIARALAAEPTFLFLDEPAAGLNESESTQLRERLRRLRDRYGFGVLVIEHDMSLIMGLCDQVHVLDYGKSLASGAPETVRADPVVIEAYLGS